jgi:hypothetical protein
MSFSRIKYDNSAYDLKLNRSVGPGDYRLFKGYNENCSKCYSYDGPKNAKSDVYTVGNNECDTEWSSMTEVESHLTNRVHKLVDDNEFGKNDSYLQLHVNPIKPACSETLISEDTRFTNPLEAYRSMDTTSYHYSPYLYVNPQCEIQGDRIGLNSRLRVKDTFKPNLTTPIDQSIILPHGNNNIQDELSLPSTYNMCKNSK